MFLLYAPSTIDVIQRFSIKHRNDSDEFYFCFQNTKHFENSFFNSIKQKCKKKVKFVCVSLQINGQNIDNGEM